VNRLTSAHVYSGTEYGWRRTESYDPTPCSHTSVAQERSADHRRIDSNHGIAGLDCSLLKPIQRTLHWTADHSPLPRGAAAGHVILKPGRSATLNDCTPAAAHPTSCMSRIPDRKSETAYSRPGRRVFSVQVRLALEQPQSLQLDQLIQGFRSGGTRRRIALLQPEPPARECCSAPDKPASFLEPPISAPQ
jgi:hypothetical protein